MKDKKPVSKQHALRHTYYFGMADDPEVADCLCISQAFKISAYIEVIESNSGSTAGINSVGGCCSMRSKRI